jgi:hypothetical protein
VNRKNHRRVFRTKRELACEVVLPRADVIERHGWRPVISVGKGLWIKPRGDARQFVTQQDTNMGIAYRICLEVESLEKRPKAQFSGERSTHDILNRALNAECPVGSVVVSHLVT